MSSQETEVLVVGAGQAGLAMSEHLSDCGVPHLVLERDRIAERWRSERWDSLVANGPAWHDRFPGLEFPDLDPDAFASKEQVADYFDAYAEKIDAPIRCGVEVTSVQRNARPGRLPRRDVGRHHRRPFRRRRDRAVPATRHPADRSRRRGTAADPLQRLPQPGAAARRQRPGGRGRIVGRADRRRAPAVGAAVYLSVGPHDRPPRRYRGRDFCWWLGVLGKWDAETPTAGRGARHHRGQRRARRPHRRLPRPRRPRHHPGRPDRLVRRRHHALRAGPRATTSPPATPTTCRCSTRPTPTSPATASTSPRSRRPAVLGPDPDCVTDPVRELDLAAAGVTSIIWATGYAVDYGWLQVDAFDENGKPQAPARRVVRARRLLPGPALAVPARIELHLGRLARRQVPRRPHRHPARLPRLPDQPGACTGGYGARLGPHRGLTARPVRVNSRVGRVLLAQPHALRPRQARCCCRAYRAGCA